MRTINVSPLLTALAAAALGGVAVALLPMHVTRAPLAEAGAGAGGGAGGGNLAALLPFWIASAVAWAVLTVLLVLLRLGARGPLPERPLAAGAIILGIAAAARIAVLAGHDPALSDDVHRYAFDGRVLARCSNPYLARPRDHLDGPDAPLAALINNPELHTIYLPGSQWLFAAIAAPGSGRPADPAAMALRFRAAFTAAELAAIGLLLVALRRAGRSPWWAALYAWHPLALSEVAGSGHQEGLGCALLVAALLVATTARAQKTWAWSALLSLATLVKPVVLPVAAFILKGRPRADWIVAAMVGAMVCGAVALPLLPGEGGAALANLSATAERFTLKWAHFGGAYEPLLWAIERGAPGWNHDSREVLARWICLFLLAALFAATWLWRGADCWQRAAALLFGMVLLSPVVHPWYLLWALVLLPMTGGRALWTASLTVPWGYAALSDPSSWRVSPWLMLAAYVPVYAVLAAETAAWWRRRGRAAGRIPFARIAA